jgi:hypothetical protein
MGTEVIKKNKIATGFALAMTTFANARNDTFKKGTGPFFPEAKLRFATTLTASIMIFTRFFI